VMDETRIWALVASWRNSACWDDEGRNDALEQCADELDAALQAASPLPPNRFDCVECGPAIAVDEDGCCRSCGRDATPVVGGQAASPVPRVEWQPIETAPVGTQVWAWDDERGSNPAMLVDGEWHITYDDAIIHPKYWQPLPDPLARKTERGAPSGV
jgi:hypothetical protein